MKLHQYKDSGINTIQACAADHVVINQQRYAENLVVSTDRLETGWAGKGFGGLTSEDFAQLINWQPEVLLIGTGKRQRFPSPALLRPLIESQIGFEVMDSAAACRTFNVLANEGRAVVAAILFDESA